MSTTSKAWARWTAALAAAALSTTALAPTAAGQASTGSATADASPPPSISQGVSNERWQILMERFADGATDDAPPSAAIAAAAAALNPVHQRTAADALVSGANGQSAGFLGQDDQQLRFHRHLPVPAAEMLLAGEHSALRVPVYVPRTEATRTTHLNVGALSSVAALSDVSSLEVYLNGTLMGTMAPRYDSPRMASFPIEPGQLVEGFNEVMFLARQQHRIECTIDGTYELWTRIVPELTGFAGDGPAHSQPTLQDLPSVLGRTATPNTLKVDLSPVRTPDEAANLLRLVNALILHGHIAEPRIVPVTSNTAGTTIAMAGDTSNVLQRPGATRFGDTDGLVLVPNSDGSATLVLTGDGDTIENTLSTLEAQIPNRPTVGSNRGLAAFDGTFLRELDDAATVTFADLGVDSHEFTGRNYSLELDLRLPGDFYEADYGSVLLYLDGAYSGNFLPNTQLSVEVNGAEAVTLDLREDMPTRLNRKELRIPLTFFQGGLNTVTLNAELLTESDLACDPEHAPVSGPRFAIADTSRIVVPRMARVGVAPNLAATMNNGYPYTLDDAPTQVHLVGDRATALGTALSLFGSITASARTVENYTVSFAIPDEGADGFVIGNSEAMPNWAAEMTGMRHVDEPATPLDDDDGFVLGSTASVADDLIVIGPQTIAASLPNLLGGNSEQQTTSILGNEGTSALRDFVAYHVSEPIADTFATLLWGAKTATPDRAFDAGDVVLAQRAISGATGLAAVSAAVLPTEPPRTLTVVAANGPEALAARLAHDDRAAPRFSASGQYYVIGDTHTQTIAAGGDGILYATQAPALMNLRYVAAGWLATNYRFYVALVSGVLLVFALLTWRATRSWQVEHTSGDRHEN